jgi:Mrp family chromosome partitioning ATPase
LASNIRGRDVIAAVLAGCEGVAELRALPSRQRVFVALEDTDAMFAFSQAYACENVYFGVASRRADTGTGTSDDCLSLGALFLDVDCKTRTQEEARATLNGLPFLPSIVVNSGGGFHVYYLLREPVDVQADRAGLTALLRRLAGALDGDLAAAEPARILRVPGTHNHKYDPPRVVEVDVFEPARRYNLSDFDFLPTLVVAPSASITELTLDEPIARGTRNPTLYRLARSLRAKKLPDGVVADTVRAVNNHRCQPPLPADELDALLRHALTQPDRGDFSAIPEPVVGPKVEQGALALTTLGELLAEPDVAPDWLVTDRIPTGGVVLLVGKPKGGKSTLARALALAVATGGTWLGSKCLAQPVIYVALEDKRSEVKAHFRKMGATGSELVSFDWPGAEDPVARVGRLAADDSAGLIIVDTLQRFIRAKNLNDYSEVTTLLTPLLAIARQTDAALVLVHHAGKGNRSGIDAPLGSTALAGTVDQVFQLVRTEKLRVFSTIQRIGSDLEQTVVKLDPSGVPVLAGTRRDAECQDVAGAVTGVLKNAGQPLTAAALKELIPGRQQTRVDALTWLCSNRQVTRTGEGKRGKPFIYTLGPAGTESTTGPSSQDMPVELNTSDSVPTTAGELNDGIAETADQGRFAGGEFCSLDPLTADPLGTEAEGPRAPAEVESKSHDSVPDSSGEQKNGITETVDQGLFTEGEFRSQDPQPAEPPGTAIATPVAGAQVEQKSSDSVPSTCGERKNGITETADQGRFAEGEFCFLDPQTAEPLGTGSAAPGPDADVEDADDDYRI